MRPNSERELNLPTARRHHRGKYHESNHKNCGENNQSSSSQSKSRSEELATTVDQTVDTVKNKNA